MDCDAPDSGASPLTVMPDLIRHPGSKHTETALDSCLRRNDEPKQMGFPRTPAPFEGAT